MENLLDLSKIGYRGAKEAGELLLAYYEERPETFWDENVKLAYNSASGKVFLTNDTCQTLMLDNDGKAKIWYFLSYKGYEGFANDLYNDFKNGNIPEEDWEELKDILEAESMEAEAKEVEAAIATA